MRRAVLNVATLVRLHYFQRGQNRLADSVRKFDPECGLCLWGEGYGNSLPSHWPKHKDKPYTFKAFALKDAAENFDLLLWCDAPVHVIAPMEPLWECIERDGYFFADVTEWYPNFNYEYTADSAYTDLFPDLSLEKSREINRTIPVLAGNAFGINMRSEIGARFFAEFYRLAKETNAFCGPSSNTNHPRHHVYSEDSTYTMAPCGPDDVLGHRFDQSVSSVLAWRLGMRLTKPPKFYAYTAEERPMVPTEETILFHDGTGLKLS